MTFPFAVSIGAIIWKVYNICIGILQTYNGDYEVIVLPHKHISWW